MKKQLLGTFMGNKIYIEADNDINWVDLWETWLKYEKNNAVNEYKDKIFFDKLQEKSKQMEKALWYKVGKFMGF